VDVRRLLVSLPLALSLALAGCTSPTLPLPPPDQPIVSKGPMPGTIHLSSVHGAEANAIVVIINHDPNVPLDKRVSGAQADGSGTWDADVVAVSGDVLEITQQFGSTLSPPTDFTVP
jgi:hypothetical protein